MNKMLFAFVMLFNMGVAVASQEAYESSNYWQKTLSGKYRLAHDSSVGYLNCPKKVNVGLDYYQREVVVKEIEGIHEFSLLHYSRKNMQWDSPGVVPTSTVFGYLFDGLSSVLSKVGPYSLYSKSTVHNGILGLLTPRVVSESSLNVLSASQGRATRISFSSKVYHAYGANPVMSDVRCIYSRN